MTTTPEPPPTTPVEPVPLAYGQPSADLALPLVKLAAFAVVAQGLAYAVPTAVTYAQLVRLLGLGWSPFQQQGTLGIVWATTGSRPTRVEQTEYAWVYLFAAVDPLTGRGSAVLAPHGGTHHIERTPAVRRRGRRARRTPPRAKSNGCWCWTVPAGTRPVRCGCRQTSRCCRCRRTARN